VKATWQGKFLETFGFFACVDHLTHGSIVTSVLIPEPLTRDRKGFRRPLMVALDIENKGQIAHCLPIAALRQMLTAPAKKQLGHFIHRQP
jgi:hypothetical protein